MSKVYYYAVYYNEEDGNFGVEDLSSAVGHEDGDIYDTDEGWCSPEEDSKEYKLDVAIWRKLNALMDTLPKMPTEQESQEEPDLIY